MWRITVLYMTASSSRQQSILQIKVWLCIDSEAYNTSGLSRTPGCPAEILHCFFSQRHFWKCRQSIYHWFYQRRSFLSSIVYNELVTRAGSWSLRALRLEGDCGPPGTYICNIDLILVLFLLLPSLLRNVVYVKTTIFAQLAPKQHKLYVERGLLHLNINIVCSKVLQALSIILTNQCDTSKQVIQFGANNGMTIQTLTWRENNAIWLQGTRSKTWTIALQLLEQTLELGLQLRFTRLEGCEPVNNRLKIKTQILSNF